MGRPKDQSWARKDRGTVAGLHDQYAAQYKTKTPMHQLTILLLSCKRLPYLLRSLEPIQSHFRLIEPDIQPIWICFDNGSDSQDRIKLEQLGFDKLVLSKDNVGIGPAMNHLISMVRTPYFLNLQDDWLLDNPFQVPFVQEAIRILESEKKLAQIKLDACHFLDFDDKSIYNGPFATNNARIEFYAQNPDMLWGGFTLPPAIAKTEALHQLGPFREDQILRRGWAESEYSARFSKHFYTVKSPQMLLFEHIGKQASPGWGPMDSDESSCKQSDNDLLSTWKKNATSLDDFVDNPKDAEIHKLELQPNRNASEHFQKILFVGPWVGEFGWQVCRWQGGVRKLVNEKYQDHYIIVAGDEGHQPFYEYANEYWCLPRFTHQQGLIRETFRLLPKHKANSTLKALKGIFADELLTYNLPVEVLLPKHYKPEDQAIIQFKPSENAINLRNKILSDHGVSKWVCIFPRKRALNPRKNWSEENWKRLISLVAETFQCGIVLMGRSEDSALFDISEKWFISTAQLSSDVQMDVDIAFLNDAIASIGSESGGPFLSLLCGCPTFVMGGTSYKDRYEKDENFLGAICKFSAKQDCQHHLEETSGEVVDFINGVLKKTHSIHSADIPKTSAPSIVSPPQPPLDLNKKSLNILITGVFHVPHSTNISLANAFANLGHRVTRYDFREQSGKMGSSRLMDEALLQVVRENHFDLAIFCKYDGVDPSALEKFNEYVPTYLWFPDWQRNIGPEILGHFQHAKWASCTGLSVAKWVEKQINKKIWHVFDGADPSIYKPIAPQPEFKTDIAFIGQWAPARQYGFELLQSKGLDCRFYGTGFAPPVYLEDFVKAACSAKINLGINFGPLGELTFSVRTWRTLACGAFFLTEYVAGMERILEDGVNIAWYRSEDELLDKLDYYLHTEKADKIRKNISDQGRRLFLNNFTWNHTANNILKVCNTNTPSRLSSSTV